MTSSLRSLRNSVIRHRLGGTSAALRLFRQAARARVRAVTRGAAAPPPPPALPTKKLGSVAQTPGLVARVKSFAARLFGRKV